MVTFRNKGRYGNVLFELATTIAYAKRHNLEFTVPVHTDDPFWAPVYYTHLANPNFNPSLEEVILEEKQYNYKELSFEESWRDKNIILDGYFQSEKYFKKYRQDILNIFGFNNQFDKKGYCSIFVRRSDYLNMEDKHPVMRLDYIKKAMDYIVANSGMKNFIVFSDDIPWCKENIINTGYEVEFNTGLPFHLEMLYMSCCSHNIIPNSTFAWWSAWINHNPDKIVVAPKTWFGSDYAHHDTSDICPETWVRL
jgi:hypothetical protein